VHFVLGSSPRRLGPIAPTLVPSRPSTVKASARVGVLARVSFRVRKLGFGVSPTHGARVHPSGTHAADDSRLPSSAGLPPRRGVTAWEKERECGWPWFDLPSAFTGWTNSSSLRAPHRQDPPGRDCKPFR
jgi:hypothetical protein